MRLQACNSQLSCNLLLDFYIHPQEVEQQLQQQDLDSLHQFVYQLYKLLLGTGRLFPCREDTTLVPGEALTSWPASSSKSSSSSSSSSSSNGSSPGSSRAAAGGAAAAEGAAGGSSSSLQQTSNSAESDSNPDGSSSSSSSSGGSSSSSSSTTPKYFFASNLRDNSVQMPHFALSLLQTLLRLPRDAAFVSVYESNSDDRVHGWIDVMQLALNVIGTPNRLVARGMLVRGEGQHR
jgi:hypothetical protein